MHTHTHTYTHTHTHTHTHMHAHIKGVDIKMVDDQDHTDLTKTVQHLLLLRSKEQLKV